MPLPNLYLLQSRCQTTWTILILQWTSRPCGTCWRLIATSLLKPLRQTLASLSTTASSTMPRTQSFIVLPCGSERWAEPSYELPGAKQNGSALTMKRACTSTESWAQTASVTKRETGRGRGRGSGSETGREKETAHCLLMKMVCDLLSL